MTKGANMTQDERRTLVNASVPGREGTFDIRLSRSEVEAVVPAASGVGHGTETTDVEGRFVMPGMWDHHVHFAQWTVQRRRLDLSGTASAVRCLARVRRNASVPGREGTFDIRLSRSEVEAVVPAASGVGHGTETTDVEGRFVMPGMWDHHVHFAQWTVQRRRLDLSGTASAVRCLARVRRVVATAHASRSADPAPIVGYGFQDGAWSDSPSLEALDEVAPEIPVVLVSKDLRCAWLNIAAARLLTLVPEEPTDLVREGEWFGALGRFQSPADLSTDDYREAARAAARRGVVGIVEFENTDNLRL